jgi:hypothetical protein
VDEDRSKTRASRCLLIFGHARRIVASAIWARNKKRRAPASSSGSARVSGHPFGRAYAHLEACISPATAVVCVKWTPTPTLHHACI